MFSIGEVEAAARAGSSDAAFAPMFGTPGDPLGQTSQANVDAWQRTDLYPQVMVDVSARSTATTVLGMPIACPVLLAPVGGMMRYDSEGEVAAARAALAAETVFCLSMASTRSMKDVTDVGAPTWFQLYVMKDLDVTERIIRGAEDHGFKALIVTVDNSSLRSRERDGQLQKMSGASPFPIYEEVGLAGFTAADYQNTKSLSFDWSQMQWLRSKTSLPIIIKGLVRGVDARRAVQEGASAVVVSNHGGHALPSRRGTVAALAEVVAAVGDTAEVYVDGGIRYGRDVLKALALGARAVLLGRAQLWGLAASGSEGVETVLQIIREELYTAMGLTGVVDVNSVPRHLVGLAEQDRAQAVDPIEFAGNLRRSGAIDEAAYQQISAALAASSSFDQS